MLGVILAAGYGSRIGRPKALLPFGGGKSFLDVTLMNTAYSGCERIVIVVGQWWKGGNQIENHDVVINPNPELGQVSSFRCALRHVGSDFSGVMMVLVDHPFVKPDTYHLLGQSHIINPDKIIIPIYSKRKGHPVVFPKWVVSEIMGQLGDKGTREIIYLHRDKVMLIDVNDPSILLDIDTQFDYFRVRNLHSKSSMV